MLAVGLGLVPGEECDRALPPSALAPSALAPSGEPPTPSSLGVASTGVASTGRPSAEGEVRGRSWGGGGP